MLLTKLIGSTGRLGIKVLLSKTALSSLCPKLVNKYQEVLGTEVCIQSINLNDL